MPNLNLKGDEPEDLNELPEAPESEPSGSGSGGSLKRTIPLIAGGALALLLAFYILNKIGIIHIWGNKKASSTVVISETADTTSQVLSDSAMAEQFRKDSLEAVAASHPAGHQNARTGKTAAKEKEKSTAEAKHQAAQLKKASDEAAKKAEAVKKAEAKKLADAEAKKNAEAKKAAAEAEARKKAEAKKAAQAEQKNMTTVEVPGVTPRRAPAQASGDEEVRTQPADGGAKERAAVKAPAREPKIAAREAARPAAASPKVKASAPAAAKKERAASASVGAASKESGKYSVQISSWTSASKARAFASRFTDAGIPAFVVEDGRIYRVCTGHFATQQAATARAEELVPMLETKYDIIMLK